jgi:hypothetical protein
MLDLRALLVRSARRTAATEDKMTEPRTTLSWTTDGVVYTAQLLRDGTFLSDVTWDDLTYADEMRIRGDDGWFDVSLSQPGEELWTFPINDGPYPFGRVGVHRDDLASGLGKLIDTLRREERAATLALPDEEEARYYRDSVVTPSAIREEQRRLKR